MYGKNKMIGVPSEAQSKEKLAMYVHEYLVHIGAQKTANSFLQEIRWDKSISVGEPPGFLHSWWSVFWDLYSAAPERRDTHEHTTEAKAFYDYGFVNSGYPNGLPHEHCMPGRPMPPNAPAFMHRVSQPGPHPGLQGPVTSMPPDSLGGAAIRQRPTLPPMMPGGQPPGPPMHPSMRFHQPPYGPPVGGMMPGHPHMPPRARWMGPQGPPMPQQQGPPNLSQTSSGGSGGVAPSPGHPGTPHVASPNNGGNPNPDSSQPPPPHYAPQQTPPQQTPNITDQQQQQQASQQQQPMFTNRNDFDGAVMMNGGGANNSGGGGRNNGPMMPPPHPEYGLAPPGPQNSYPGGGGDVKMSPMHSGVDMMGNGGQTMLMDYGGNGGNNGGGTGGGFGQPQIPPEMMGQQPGNSGQQQIPSSSASGGQMMQQQQQQPPQQHNVMGNCQGPPPPPQYMSSAGGLCGTGGGQVQFPVCSVFFF
ncbi:unnamed protein product [Rodentolepis nana]|uniref:LisH domain-containing protein n=1 Tax=Rodentolepis nana TaxID=102285 RepID=A0A0R3T5M8_RODNA|nr:unnamed protein product [Rodentolepis nana]